MRSKMPIWSVLQLIYVLSIASASPVTAGTLSEAEVAHLREEITFMTAALAAGDPERIIERTHPSLAEMAGGREVLAKLTRDAVKQLPKDGVKIVGTVVGTPTKTYPAGEEEVCFVPTVSTIDVKEKQLKSTGFMVAIRQNGAKEWKYLDGAALASNPELLWKLLPKLVRNVVLPENKIEML